MKLKLLATAAAMALALAGGPAAAQYSGNVVKIGVLTDMSSLYADINGPGAVAVSRPGETSRDGDEDLPAAEDDAGLGPDAAR